MEQSQIIINGIVFLPHTWPLLAVFMLTVCGSMLGLVVACLKPIVRPRQKRAQAIRLNIKPNQY
jgi:hypothetical protein